MGSCGTKIQKENIPRNITNVSNAPNICCITAAKSPPHIFAIHNELEHKPEPFSLYDHTSSTNINNKTYSPITTKDDDKVLKLDNIDKIDKVDSSSPQLSPINLLSEDDEEDLKTPIASSPNNVINNNTNNHQAVNIMNVIPHPTERRESIIDSIGLLHGSSAESTSSSSSFGFESLRETAIASYKRPSNISKSSFLHLPTNVSHIQDDGDDKTENSNKKEKQIEFDNDTIQPLYDQNINIQNEPLIDLRFNRTLFCEDITYEYQLKCTNLQNIDPWILRLTVENLTKYYGETLTKWREQQAIKHNNNNNEPGMKIGIDIPCQFGKVMTPKVFSELIGNILQNPSLLKSIEFGEKTANFLSIPYDIRSIIQYNTDTYFYGKLEDRYQDNAMDFKFYDIMCENDDKYKYLCHSQAVYHQDYEYDDCCQCYDQPLIKCYSYWIRSLHHDKIDFLINCTSNNIFTIVMSDLSSNIAKILTNDIGIDENSAWIITDYLPKYLLFNHADNKFNASIIYKYDPRDLIHSDCEEMIEYFEDDVIGIHSVNNLNHNAYEDDGQFLVSDNNNSLNIIKRHNIDINDLHQFCQSMRIQHTAISNNPEISVSVSEFIESMTRSCQDLMTATLNSTSNLSDGAYSGNNNVCNFNQIVPNPDEFGIIKEDEEQRQLMDGTKLEIYNRTDDENDEDERDEQYRVFFNAFIDEEGDDDINICQWLSSVQKLPVNLNEKQIVSAFKYMLQQNEDNEGFIDFVDFTNFCQDKISDNDDVKKAQRQINGFISSSRNR